MDETELYLLKALDCIDGAESEYANRRYDNCANRCYYAVRRENLVEDPGCKPERQRKEGLWVDRFTWRRKPKGTAAYR